MSRGKKRMNMFVFTLHFWLKRSHGKTIKMVTNTTRKATGFKSLRVNCREINEVTLKMLNGLFGQNL